MKRFNIVSIDGLEERAEIPPMTTQFRLLLGFKWLGYNIHKRFICIMPNPAASPSTLLITLCTCIVVNFDLISP